MKQRRKSSTLGGLALAASVVCIAAALLPVAAYAASEGTDTTTASVAVLRYCHVTYSGGDVTFEMDDDDFECGHIDSPDHGDVNWITNCQPWEIRITRSEWQREEGGCEEWNDRDIHLTVNHGNEGALPGQQEWINVDTIQTEPPWMVGNTTGSGTRTYLDWKVLDIGWEDGKDGHGHHHNHRGDHYGPPPEGHYSCTVTFTIEYTGPQ